MSSIIFDDWVWSYSRLQCWNKCPYCFALKYMYRDGNGASNFFSDYGTLIHKLHEMTYKNEMQQCELIPYFISHFPTNAPNSKIKSSYFMDGVKYLEGGIKTPPSILGVEQRLNFSIGENAFTGFVDLMYADNDGVVILDHKSHILSDRSTRSKPTKTDIELDEYLKQLYLYAYAVEQTGIGHVGKLVLNCFRSRKMIVEQYDKRKELAAIDWADRTIETIKQSETFFPNPDWFYCNMLCDMRGGCEYCE